jgi:hypothetical protein
MNLELLIALAGLGFSVLTYFLGIWSERRRHKLEDDRERQRFEYAERKERENREREIISKVADEYVHLVRRHIASGASALERLGLELLGSDKLVRDAIHEMHVRTGTDPWSGQASHVDGVDLVVFFAFVRQHRLSFFNVTVEEVAKRVRASSNLEKT